MIKQRGEMARRESARGGEAYEAIHVSSTPIGLRPAIKELAQSRSTSERPVLDRDLYAEAIADLLAASEAGEVIVWRAPRRSGKRLMIWVPVSLAARFQALAGREDMTHTVIFLEAMRRYCAKHSLAVVF